MAALSGISAEYYTRLEQGHDRHPSAQVLGAIARALQLDEPSTARLLALAAPTGPRRHPGSSSPERVPPTVQRLLDWLPLQPAFVQGRYMDVLAANPLMVALSPTYRPGTNILRAAFLGREVHDLFLLAGADRQLLVVYQTERPAVPRKLSRCSPPPRPPFPKTLDFKLT